MGIVVARGEELRTKMFNVLDLLGTVIQTLGPCGKNALIDKPVGGLTITKDGVSVIDRLESDDDVEHAILQKITEACRKTDKEAGDGTTTAALILKELIKAFWDEKDLESNTEINGTKEEINLDYGLGGLTLFELQTNLTALTEKICGEIDKVALEINTDSEELYSIALSAANGDEGLAKTIVDAYRGAGNWPVIELMKGNEDEVVVQKGFRINRGYVNSYFNLESHLGNSIMLKDAHILVTTYDLTESTQWNAFVENVVKKLGVGTPRKPLLLIANSVKDNFLNALMTNHHGGQTKIVPIHPAYFGMTRKDFYDDLSCLLGGKTVNADIMLKDEIDPVPMTKVVQEWVGEGELRKQIEQTVPVLDPKTNKPMMDYSKCTFSDVTKEMFGSAEKIEITNEQTSIFLPGGNEEVVKARAELIMSKILEWGEDSRQVNVHKMKQRYNALTQSAVQVHLTAGSEAEYSEREDRAIDVVRAIRSALEEGIVPGGGSTLASLSFKVPQDTVAGKMIRTVLRTPMMQLLQNAGYPDIAESIADGQVVLPEKYVGFTFKDGSAIVGDIRDTLVFDPAKVAKCALRNAVSVAGILLTMGTVIVPKRFDMNDLAGLTPVKDTPD